jgi:Flp pilus assembly protein TadD, contains TPR repeats
MKVRCETCKAEYTIDEGRVGPEGLQIRCPRCRATVIVTNDAVGGGEIFDFNAVDHKAIGSGGVATDEPLELDRAASQAHHDLPPLPSFSTTSSPSGLDLVTEPSPRTPASTMGSSLPPLHGQALPPLPGPDTATEPSVGNEGQMFEFQNRDITGPEATGAETAPSTATSQQRYRIRRKNGKVFGPFDGESINRMLFEHQLMGNEEASDDGTTYKPLGAFPEFADTIRTLMDEPVISAPLPQQPVSAPEYSVESRLERRPGDGSPRPDIERGGTAFRSRSMLLALGGAALVIVVGLGLGLTRYGLFGYRLISDTDSKTATDSDRLNQDARATTESMRTNEIRLSLSQDTFAGYKKVIAALEPTLERNAGSVDDLYLLGVSYATLLRKYGANDYFQNRSQKVLDELKKNYPEHPETATVEAASLILTNPVQAHQRLEPLLKETALDKEVLVIAGWASAYQKKWREAAQYLDRATVIDPEFAKAYHALGEIQALQGDVENAALFFQKALEKNPQHLSSALELGRIMIEVNADHTRGEEYLDQVFGKHFEELAPSERAQAFFLRAKILMSQHKYDRAMAELTSAIELAPKQAAYLVTQGNLYVNMGEYAQALTDFEKALSLDPQNLEAQIGKGRSLWQTGDIPKAKALLEQTSDAAKENPWPLYYLGQIAEKLLKAEDALGYYQKAIIRNPQFLLAHVAMAKMAQKRGDLAGAQNQLANAAAIDAHAAAVQNGLGEVHYDQKNFSQAEAAFKAALENDPEFVPAYVNLANTYRELGRYDEAVANYQAAVVRAPKYPGLAREYGYTLVLRKDYPAAIDLYRQAIRLNPKDDSLYLQVGIASLENGDTQTAAKYFQTAIDLNGDNVEALAHLGILLYQEGSLDQSQEMLKRAIEIDKNNPDIHYAMGRTFLASKQWVDALEELRTTVKLKSDHVEAVQELSKLLIDRGQYQEAITILNRAITAQPKHIELLLLLGDVYRSQSLLPEALKIYQKSLAVNPKAGGVALRLARSYDELNQKAAAIKFYLEAIKQEPDNAQPHYYLGYIYKATNKKNLAVTEFRRYLQLRPDAPDAIDVNDEIAYLQNE